MQVILLDKIANLGSLGEIVKVKDGFARNYLIPTRRARRATEAAKAEFEARRAELEQQSSDKLTAAQALCEKLNGQSVKLTQKAGVDGRLFGSVTNHDIADELKKQGFDVHKSQVRMPAGPIKIVGDSAIQVALHTDVVAQITVSVYGETA
ncbi:MAG: 50S ribosomal protein L9 [Burkholderiaceae bacterium]|jgi:large subunit ribosomal protein L9|nr:50S ribosomal protein L9 [Burkholderiaceae bacterium]